MTNLVPPKRFKKSLASRNTHLNILKREREKQNLCAGMVDLQLQDHGDQHGEGG